MMLSFKLKKYLINCDLILLFLVLSALSVLIFHLENYLLLVFFTVAIYFAVYKKIHFFSLIFVLFLSILMGVIFVILLPFKFSNLNNFQLFFEEFHLNIGRKKLFHFIEQHYSNAAADFIKLLLFNEFSHDLNWLFHKFSNLGIIHLFVVSGLHISFFLSILKKFFGRHVLFGKLFNFTWFLCYLYFLNFSISALRTFIFLVIELVWKGENIFTWKLIFAISFFLFFSTHTVATVSFLLSFGSTFLIHEISLLKIRNKLGSFLLLNVSLWTFSQIIVTSFSGYLNWLSIFNSWLTTSLIMSIYIFFFFLFAFVFLAPFLELIVRVITIVFSNLDYLIIKTNVAKINPDWYILAYLIWFLVFLSILTMVRKWQST